MSAARFPLRAVRFEDAAHYLWQRAVQAVAEGWRWSGAVERLVEGDEAWGARALYEDEGGALYQSIYVYDDHTGRGHYRRFLEAHPLPVVTAPACDLERYLVKNSIPHEVIGSFGMTKEYRAAEMYYGDRCAVRSGVYYMHHIDEGLRVLRDVGATEAAMRAYCLHAVLQEDGALAESAWRVRELSDDPYVILLAMEYRNIANGALSYREMSDASEIALGPLGEVADMLRADKVQNYKDFLLYHAQTHPRRAVLDRYFRLWLERLGVEPERFEAWRAALDVPRWHDAMTRHIYTDRVV